MISWNITPAPLTRYSAIVRATSRTNTRETSRGHILSMPSRADDIYYAARYLVRTNWWYCVV